MNMLVKIMLKTSHKASQVMGSNNMMDDPNVGLKESPGGTIEHNRVKALIFTLTIILTFIFLFFLLLETTIVHDGFEAKFYFILFHSHPTPKNVDV
jgi:hypothetical protein